MRQSRAEATATIVGSKKNTKHNRPDGWRVAFNNVYASNTPGYVTQPNALLVSTVEGHKPGVPWTSVWARAAMRYSLP